MSDTNQPSLEQIRNAVYSKYTQEEIQEFAEMGARVANKVVVHLLRAQVQHSMGADSADLPDILAEIDATLKYGTPARLEIGFKEFAHRLCICLSIVDKDYRTEIDIPAEVYANELFHNYDLLKQYAVAYWHAYMDHNADLVTKIRAACPGVDFDKLKMERENPTTLFFDITCPKRIGIFCYYVDKKGRHFHKRAQSSLQAS